MPGVENPSKELAEIADLVAQANARLGAIRAIEWRGGKQIKVDPPGLARRQG